jgi:hypothetical protein
MKRIRNRMKNKKLIKMTIKKEQALKNSKNNIKSQIFLKIITTILLRIKTMQQYKILGLISEMMNFYQIILPLMHLLTKEIRLLLICHG